MAELWDIVVYIHIYSLCDKPNGINLPFGNGVYHQFMLILRTVYYLLDHIALKHNICPK